MLVKSFFAISTRAGAVKRGTSLMAIGVLLSMTVGCGSEQKQLPVAAATGKVSFQGQVPVGAKIALHPVKDLGASASAPIGSVKEDGSFSLMTYEPGDGAPAGDYVATIQWFKFDKELNGAGPNVIPKKYADVKSSPLKVTINSSPTEIPPISIGKD